MRPIDSSYDRATAETRATDPGQGTYALVANHNGPCSLVGQFGKLAEAIDAARGMDTDDAPTELEDAIGYDGSDDRDDRGLIDAATAAGWRIVATAPAGEYWTVLAPTWYLAPADDPANEHAAGYDGNTFASRAEAEAAIPALMACDPAFADTEWVAVQRGVRS